MTRGAGLPAKLTSAQRIKPQSDRQRDAVPLDLGYRDGLVGIRGPHAPGASEPYWPC